MSQLLSRVHRGFALVQRPSLTNGISGTDPAGPFASRPSRERVGCFHDLFHALQVSSTCPEGRSPIARSSLAKRISAPLVTPSTLAAKTYLPGEWTSRWLALAGTSQGHAAAFGQPEEC